MTQLWTCPLFISMIRREDALVRFKIVKKRCLMDNQENIPGEMTKSGLDNASSGVPFGPPTLADTKIQELNRQLIAARDRPVESESFVPAATAGVHGLKGILEAAAEIAGEKLDDWTNHPPSDKDSQPEESLPDPPDATVPETYFSTAPEPSEPPVFTAPEPPPELPLFTAPEPPPEPPVFTEPEPPPEQPMFTPPTMPGIP
jgi:hypothetical protein